MTYAFLCPLLFQIHLPHRQNFFGRKHFLLDLCLKDKTELFPHYLSQFSKLNSNILLVDIQMRHIKRYKSYISLPNLAEKGCENIVHLNHPLHFSTQVFLNLVLSRYRGSALSSVHLFERHSNLESVA